MNRWSQTPLLSSGAESEDSGGHGYATRSTMRAGGGVPPPHHSDTPATPITPSCRVTPHQRTGLRPPTASAMASPNSYYLLGEDEESVTAAHAAPPPGSNNPRGTVHGWDLFVNSLDARGSGPRFVKFSNGPNTNSECSNLLN